eukprot:Gb_30263 [translate_table: standard]
MEKIMYLLLCVCICILAGGAPLGEGRIVGKRKNSAAHAKDSHDVKRDYSRRVMNKLPSGPSPGVGHKYINGHVKATGTADPSHYKANPLNKLPSGPSPGIGHKYTHHAHDFTIPTHFINQKPSGVYKVQTIYRR